jgi:hypothetical protein
MTYIVNKVQGRVGDNWVGSSVVHLGDHSRILSSLSSSPPFLFPPPLAFPSSFSLLHADVPNALMFIDKYTQISRILNPIIIALRRAADLMKDPQLCDCIYNYVGRERGKDAGIIIDNIQMWNISLVH